VPEIIMEVVKNYNYPVCFDFPAGHIPDNQSLILGRMFNLSIKEQGVSASYS
jgi:muramoyltetrapeptide carboxypeptidase